MNKIILSGIFIVSFLFYLLQQRMHPLTGDEFNILVQGERILRGEVPYRDFFQFTTPGSHYLVALLFWIFGVNLSIIKIAVSLTGGVLVSLTYLLSKKIINRPLFSLLPAVLALYFSTPHFPLYSHHWLSNVFVLLSMLFAAGFFSNGSLLKIIISGATAGITFLLLQHKGILLLASVLAALFLSRLYYEERFLKPAIYFLCGFVLLVLPYILYLLFSGSLREMFYDCFIWTYKNYLVFNSYPEYLYPDKKYISHILKQFSFPLNIIKARELVFIGYLPIFILLYGLLSITWKFVAENRIEEKSRNKIFILYYLAGMFLFLTVLPRPDSSHILFVLVPFLILLSFFLEELYQRSILKRPNLLLSAPILLLTISFYANVIYGCIRLSREAGDYNYPLKGRGGTIFFPRAADAEAYSRVLNYIDNEIADSKVFIYNWSSFFYFLSGKINYTKYDSFIPGYNTQEQMDELVNEIKNHNTKFIIHDSIDESLVRYGPNSSYPEGSRLINLDNALSRFIAEHYKLVEKYGDFKIYRRKGEKDES